MSKNFKKEWLNLKLCGVVVAFNPDKSVIHNIETYLDGLDKLYIIDNSLTSHQELFQNKKIKYIANGKNTGMAHALNQGVDFAREDGFQYILTMDQDSYFEESDFSKYKEQILKNKSNKIGIYTPLHYTKSEKINHSIQTNPLVVMTSGNILNMKIHQELGGFKEWLFIDGVDQEYCLNLRKHGYDIKVFENILLHHSLGSIENRKLLGHTFMVTNHSYIRRYFITRNRLYINQLYQEIFTDFCRKELENTKKETIKIILFEKDKLKKIHWIRQGKKDFLKNIKGMPSYVEEELK